MAILKPTHTITPDVAFTSNTYITNGAHILYITSDQQTYIDNAVSFIATGLELGHCTVFMENIEIISIIKGKLLKKGVNQKQLETVIFGDHEVFTIPMRY
jgi:two-component system sporulation sensor kinase A